MKVTLRMKKNFDEMIPDGMLLLDNNALVEKSKMKLRIYEIISQLGWQDSK